MHVCARLRFVASPDRFQSRSACPSADRVVRNKKTVTLTMKTKANTLVEFPEFIPLDGEQYSPDRTATQKRTRLPSFLIAKHSIHVRFDNLPLPDPETNLHLPAHGQIAQRRVARQDVRRARRTHRAWVYHLEAHPFDQRVVWRDVEWREPGPHPGERVDVALMDGEVSPRTVSPWERDRAGRGSHGSAIAVVPRWVRRVLRRLS